MIQTNEAQPEKTVDQIEFDQNRRCKNCPFANIAETNMLNQCLLPRETLESGVKIYYFIGPNFFCCHKKYSFEVVIEDYRARLANKKGEK